MIDQKSMIHTCPMPPEAPRTTGSYLSVCGSPSLLEAFEMRTGFDHVCCEVVDGCFALAEVAERKEEKDSVN